MKSYHCFLIISDVRGVDDTHVTMADLERLPIFGGPHDIHPSIKDYILFEGIGLISPGVLVSHAGEKYLPKVGLCRLFD